MSKHGAEASKIKTYLEQQNRPYSANDIFLNLHKEIGKTAVQKCLDQLSSDGVIKEKTYGKQKVYVADQSQFSSLNEEELKAIEVETSKLTQELTETEKELREHEAKVNKLNSTLTTEEAVKRVQEVETEVSHMEKKLEDLEQNCVLVSNEEREKTNKENEMMMKQWRKRKRLAMDILNAILEEYPKSKRELFEDIGIETDEDVGAQLC
ncbi:homologous-pairing protein 2 homolog [Oratosquilla oratoria]|uniref:homologous-pairing protein 2 homolog n=1 Tax=Oratosquilla oratoria TaxID=337810 RepID=UPI003F76600D